MSDVSQQSGHRGVLEQALQAIDKLQKQLDDRNAQDREPIAIVGMACRYPGAPSLDDYWRLLERGDDAVSTFPADRRNRAIAGLDLDTIHGGFLDNIDQFDPAHFGIAGREAESMDPQQRLVLEVAWEALENAGIAPDSLRNSNAGVYVGITTNDYARMAMSGDGNLDVYSATGGALNVAAGRVSYALGFNGPAMAIDTACSSSLVAIHVACQNLRQGDCRVALAGGVNVLLALEPFVCFADWGMMAPDGRCKTFDEKADGFVRSEGCGIIVLKRLSAARADGDNILALIRGTAVNQDGASSGLTVPNGLAQEKVFRAALDAAGLQSGAVDYVEAHGTGTTLGDPIELEAVAGVYGKGRAPGQPLKVGSVKTNIGHSESASGVAGLIKVVLALQHQQIPRHIHFTRLNPQISLRGAPVEIAAEASAWARGERARIGGISSFGFSGTNAHVIVSEADAQDEPEAAAEEAAVRVLPLSARTGPALAQLAARYRDYLAADPEAPFGAICRTAAIGRARFGERLAVVAESAGEASAALAAWVDGQPHAGLHEGTARQPAKAVFLFTGQGSQYPGMGAALYASEPVFREAFDACAARLSGILPLPLADVIGYTGAGDDITAQLHLTGYTQPALFAFEFALAELWRSRGIVPHAVIGHSLGEYVAACVAGVMSMPDAITFVARRAQLMQALPGGGAMAAIRAERSVVEQALADHAETVSIAAANAPQSTVVSGRADEVDAVVAALAGRGIESTPLQVSHAFHSPLMRPVVDELLSLARSVDFGQAGIDLVLNATATSCKGDTVSADYWVRHAMQPVLFGDSVCSLVDKGYRTFLEIGPAPVLSGLAAQVPDAAECTFIPSLRRGELADREFQGAVAALFACGMEPDWRAVLHGTANRRAVLPSYPFQRRRFWLQTGQRGPAAEPAGHSGAEGLLGSRVETPLQQILFENVLSLKAYPALGDHRVGGRVIFPAAGFIEVAAAAGREVVGGDDVTVDGGWFREPLFLDDDAPRRTQVVLTPAAAGTYQFEIFSSPMTAGAAAWACHAGGSLRRGDGDGGATQEADDASAKCTGTVDTLAFGERMTAVGLDYGPAFRGLVAATSGEQSAFGRLELAADDELSTSLRIHPGILDAAFHLIGVAMEAGENNTADIFYLPVGFRRARLYRSPGTKALAHARLDKVSAELVEATITVWDGNGQLAARIEGLQARGMSASAFRALTLPRNEALHVLEWRELAPPDGTGEQRALCIVGADSALRRGVVEAAAARELDTVVCDRWPDDVETLGGRTLIDLRPADAARDCSRALPDSAAVISVVEPVLTALRTAAAGAGVPDRYAIVTRSGQAVAGFEDVDPSQSAVWGLAAAAAVEIPGIDLRLVDIAADDTGALVLDAALETAPETRQGIRNERRFGQRLVAGDGATLAIPEDGHAVRVVEPGSLAGLGIHPAARVAPAAGQVEIEVLASGVNFRDVLTTLDMYPGPASELGNECCGRIVAVGPGVDGFNAGDLVSCIAEGTFGSHVIAEAGLVFAVPASLSVTQASIFPIAQLTAYLSLHEIGRLRAADRVLIHAGAGGVGLAAVHLALAAGAEVLATAGSSAKREYLRQLGATHVFDSRETLAHSDVLAATDGRGVDIVLNSLTGDAIDEGLRSLAAGGRFIEIGLRDVRSDIAVAAIREDVTYHPVLLGDQCRDDPAFVRRMYAALVDLLDSGRIPAPPVRSFALSEISAAFDYMAKARHIGRIAVVQPAFGRHTIRPDASYLVSGGMGGLGLQVARWLAERGARYIVLVGRSKPGDAAAQAVAELEERGITVTIVQGDIADPAVLEKGLRSQPYPLRGAVHAAGVLQDAMLGQVDAARLLDCLQPKLAGLDSIDRATQDVALDFLALFSSASAILGSPGQAAYASANACLDGAATHLRATGRNAVSINWGAWAETGMAANVSDRVADDWAAMGIGRISTDEGLAALEQAIGGGRAGLAVMPMDWSLFLARALDGPVPGFLSELDSRRAAPVAGDGPAESGLLDTLRNLPARQRRTTLIRRLRAEIAAVLNVPENEVDAAAGLTDQGMDSLMAVEVAKRLGRLLQIALPTTFVFDTPTVNALADYITAELWPDKAAADDSTATADDDAISDAVENLSDDEVQAALLAELDDAGLGDG